MSEKVATRESSQAAGGRRVKDRATSHPAPIHTAPSPGQLSGLDPRFGAGMRAATTSAAHATIGTAHLNRLMNGGLGPQQSRVVRRACNCGGTCPECRQQQALRAGEGAGAVATAPASAKNAVTHSTGGQPLETRVRRQMESAFGRDLGQVRVHRDAPAALAASDLSARAFTVGDHVFFGSGRWAPDTDDGRELLGHEIAHVVQYADGGAKSSTARADDLTVGSPADPLETEAREAGRRVRRGERVGPSTPSFDRARPSVQRDVLDDAWGTVSSAGHDLAQGAESLGHSVAQGVSTAVGEVQQGIGAAAHGVAAAGSAISSAVSGSHAGVVINFPDIPLLRAEQTPLTNLPPLVVHVPLLEAGAALGPVILEADIGLQVAIRPEFIAVLGPAAVRNIHVVLDPLHNTYTASGRLQIAASASEIVSIEPGIDVEAVAIIMAGELPIPVEADAFGGLRLALRGTGLGTIDEAVTLGYRAGEVFLDSTTDLKLGARLDAELDATLEINVYEEPVCEYTWPLATWPIAENAEQYTLPLSLSYGSGGARYSVGPLASRAIPVSSIEAVIPTLPRTRDCASLDRLIAVLCKKGVLPPQVCAVPGHGGGAQFAPSAAGGGILTDKVPSGLTGGDPIPITWFKPLAEYPDPITLTDWRGETRDFRMTRPGQIVEPGRAIGVARAYPPSYGKIVQLMQVIEDEDRRGEVERFRPLLARHGFNLTGYDIDHVQDIAWDGPDNFANLWPLDSVLNQAAGRNFRNMRITYSNVRGGGPATPDTTDKRLDWAARTGSPNNVIGRYFIIREIRA